MQCLFHNLKHLNYFRNLGLSVFERMQMVSSKVNCNASLNFENSVIIGMYCTIDCIFCTWSILQIFDIWNIYNNFPGWSANDIYLSVTYLILHFCALWRGRARKCCWAPPKPRQWWGTRNKTSKPENIFSPKLQSSYSLVKLLPLSIFLETREIYHLQCSCSYWAFCPTAKLWHSLLLQMW